MNQSDFLIMQATIAKLIESNPKATSLQMAEDILKGVLANPQAVTSLRALLGGLQSSIAAPTVDLKPVRVSVLVDETASMLVYRDKVTQGLRAYFETLKRKSPNAIVTVTFFNSRNTRMVYGPQVIESIPSFSNYSPAGETPLWDSIAGVIDAMDFQIVQGKEDAVIAIITDGQDNKSQHYNKSSIRNIISSRQKLFGWRFAYMGANQDAQAIGHSIGIEEGDALTFEVDRIDDVFRRAANTVSTYANLGVHERASYRFFNDSHPGNSLTDEVLRQVTRSTGNAD